MSEINISATAESSALAMRVTDEQLKAYTDLFRKIVNETKPLGRKHEAPQVNPDRAYTITTLSAHEVYGGDRTVGIFRRWSEAVEIVLTNAMDIWETTYHLVVVEEVYLDEIYGGMARRRGWWFKWNREEKKYEEAECPPSYKNVSGFGIG